MAEITFEGGINERDITQVKSQECIEGYNFELGELDSHLQPRKPFDLKGTSTNTSDIRGFVQLITADDTETTLVQSGDTVYEWDGPTFTSRGTVTSTSKLRGTTWTLGGYSVITDINKDTMVQKWDGATLGALTTGLGATLFAKYGIVHLNRMWLLNVKSGTDTPHLIVASAFEDPESYDTALRAKDASFTTGNEAFYLVAPNLSPINGVALYFNTLIFSTEAGTLYKLTGADSTDFAIEPLYSGSAATGTETFANIGNDVTYLRQGGGIESFESTDRFGDVETDDISRFIRVLTKGLTDCITIYDQARQKVFYFTESNSVLVFYKNMISTGLSPWSCYKTSHTSNFSPNSAIYMREPGGTDYNVFFGDDSGNIYRFEGTGNGDGGTTDVTTYRKTKLYESKGLEQEGLAGRVYYRRVAEVDLIIQCEWGDDYSITQSIVPLKGPGVSDAGNYFGGSAYFGGDFYFNEGFVLSQRVSTRGYSPVGKGTGVYIMLSVTDNQTFDILKLTDDTEAEA